jgi:CHAT domain-containing protein
MIAGAPTVLGSLWNVSDASTTRLMLDFYSEFLTTGAGEALARAKRKMRADARYRHPYYWAAFALYGWDK